MADFNLSDIDLGSGADIDGFLSDPNGEQGGVYTTSSIMQTIMPKGEAQPDFDVGSVQGQAVTGIDALFAQRVQLAHNVKRRLIARTADLNDFTRISAETLVHKSNNDLWALRKEADGKFYVERLFDDNGEPLRG